MRSTGSLFPHLFGCLGIGNVAAGNRIPEWTNEMHEAWQPPDIDLEGRSGG
jgi:hypothetical protein